MKTLVLDEPGQFSFQQTEKPLSPNPGEALVQVHRVGICGTDLHAFAGNQPFFSYPRILGHELGVEIIELGAGDTDLAIGDLCAVEPYINCGVCVACRRGATNACVNMQVLGVHTDGGMREFIHVPMEKLHKANDVPVDQLALVEMLSIGAHAVRRANLDVGENVLVIGAGPIGLGTAQFAKIKGTRVIMMDINPERLAFCRDNLGIKDTIDARENPLETLKELTNGELPTAVFDATGNPKSMMSAFEYVAHSGRLIYVGLFKGDITFNDPYFHSHEITLISSRNATGDDIRHVIDSLATGKVKLDGWITHTATPETFIEQFPSWTKPETGVIKAMLTFGAES